MFKIKEYIRRNYCYEVSKELVVEDYPTYFKVKGLELLEEGDYLGISNNYDIPIEVYNLLLDYPLGTTKIEEGLFVIVSIDKDTKEEIREILLLDS